MSASEHTAKRGKGGTLFGAAGLVMALCCLAGPAVLGAVAGAAVGNVLGIAVAVGVAVAVTGAVVLFRRREDQSGC
jgi:hypothetical protein